ncbi:nucleotidyltransferase domain-containing protein [Streptomyces violaceorubidus]
MIDALDIDLAPVVGQHRPSGAVRHRLRRPPLRLPCRRLRRGPGAACTCCPPPTSVGSASRRRPRSRWDRDGVEMDLVTHDLRKFVRLMLRRNGYVLEQLLSPLVVHTTKARGNWPDSRPASSPATTPTTTGGSRRPSGGCSRSRTAEAAAVHLPGAPHRHPPDAHRRGAAPPADPRRGGRRRSRKYLPELVAAKAEREYGDAGVDHARVRQTWSGCTPYWTRRRPRQPSPTPPVRRPARLRRRTRLER